MKRCLLGVHDVDARCERLIRIVTSVSWDQDVFVWVLEFVGRTRLYREDWDVRSSDDPLGGTSKEQTLEALPTVSGHRNEIDSMCVSVVDDDSVRVSLSNVCNSAYASLLGTVGPLSNQLLAFLLEDIDNVPSDPCHTISCCIRHVEDMDCRIVYGRDIEDVLKYVCCPIALVDREEKGIEHM